MITRFWAWLRGLFGVPVRAAGWQQLYHGELTGKATLRVEGVKPHGAGLDWEYVPVKFYIESKSPEPIRVWIGQIIFMLEPGASVPTQAAIVCPVVDDAGAEFEVRSTGAIHLDLWTF